jgi:hypothetical protein
MSKTKHQYSIDRAIAHYKAIIKGESGRPRHGTAPLEEHYAMGALEVLEKVKALRDAIREEMRDLWKRRGSMGAADLYYHNKEMLNCLNNLMECD